MDSTPNTQPTTESSAISNKLAGKTVNFDLVGQDGNAFALLGAFRHQARREHWTQEEIETVMEDAISGDYDHLLAVLMVYCNPQ